MRAFIALELPQHIKDHLQMIQDRLKNVGLGARWVAPHNIHITLKFLGDVEPIIVEKVKEIVRNCAQRTQCVQTHITRLGFFPDERKPRVLFAAMDNEEILKKIAQDLQCRLEDIGFAKENRFKAHATLARIKSTHNIDLLLKKIVTLSPEQEFSIEALTLFQSKLTSHGPIYEVILKEMLKS
jgi:2'-5' RNA ligase